MPTLLISLLILLAPVMSFAAPAITGTSGTYSHGGTITISGSGFGTKSPAKPAIWAPFEGASVGLDSSLSSQSLDVDASYSQSAADNPHARSTKAIRAIVYDGTTKDSSPVGLIANADYTSLYVFNRRKYAGDFFPWSGMNYKHFRVYPTASGFYLPDWILVYSNYGLLPTGADRFATEVSGASYQPNMVESQATNNVWFTEEVQAKTNDLGSANGTVKVWRDGLQLFSKTNIVFQNATSTGVFRKMYVQNHATFLRIGGPEFTYDQPPPTNAYVYVDDLYMDITMARVMLGNASAFNACTHREPLIPTAWSTSSITAYFNQGAFSNGQNVYVFVVDSTGAASPGKLITISGTYVDTTAPYIDNVLPAPSSTGVLETNRTISFDVNDVSNVMSANGAVTIEGIGYTCAAGLTCTGNGTPKLHVVRTMGSDWTPSQVVNVVILGFKDSLGNWDMDGYTYSYTIRAAPATLTINTTTLPDGTVGTPYSQPISISGGTSPYTCSTPLGSWPTGITFAPNCSGWSGTPMASGIFSGNAFVMDSLGATDNQDISITINSAPGGARAQDTGDTFVNLYALDTNYADNTYVEVYTYPANTVSNRILDNIVISLPTNATIISAKLRKYVIGTDGGGGDNTMRLYVYPVTGMPAINLVTWRSFDDNGATLGAAESYADVTKTPGWVEWVVSDMTRAAYAAGTTLFLAIDGAGTSSQDSSRQFASGQNADTNIRPQLVITYSIGTTPNPTPTISAPGKLQISNSKMRCWK